MKFLVKIIFIFSFLFSLTLTAQNKVIQFDGINDYLDLGNQAGNNIRTIEFWFKSNQSINSNLTDFKSLIYRETSLSANPPSEFGIFFDPIGAGRGKIRFFVSTSTGSRHQILSNSNSWNANQWYHIAAVIDPISGMKMFVDGIQQNDVNSYTGTTGTSNSITSAGKWGYLNFRYFDGSLDNLKFYSTAFYSNNFQPDCPNFPSAFPDRAYWSFNGASSSTAFDGTSNSYFANIHGANRTLEEVCEVGNIISFDGINDYLDLGPSAGNNIRTIECWIKPDQNINSSLTDFKGLVNRETSLSSSPPNEFGLFFDPIGSGSGKIRFYTCDQFGNCHQILSNSNQWNANQWYHVAVSIHPIQGMKMFIDGVQQNDINSYTGSTGNSSSITTSGKWGNLNIRYFKGSIDDLKFHSTAVYNSSFTPACPDQASLIADHGNWNFNGKNRNYVTDSSANNFFTSIFGASRDIDTICNNFTLGLSSNLNPNNSLLLYPNPSQKWINFDFENNDQNIYRLELIDVDGKLVFSKIISSINSRISIESFSDGIYFYRLVGKDSIYSGKFIKQ